MFGAVDAEVAGAEGHVEQCAVMAGIPAGFMESASEACACHVDEPGRHESGDKGQRVFEHLFLCRNGEAGDLINHGGFGGHDLLNDGLPQGSEGDGGPPGVARVPPPLDELLSLKRVERVSYCWLGHGKLARQQTDRWLRWDTVSDGEKQFGLERCQPEFGRDVEPAAPMPAGDPLQCRNNFGREFSRPVGRLIYHRSAV